MSRGATSISHRKGNLPGRFLYLISRLDGGTSHSHHPKGFKNPVASRASELATTLNLHLSFQTLESSSALCPPCLCQDCLRCCLPLLLTHEVLASRKVLLSSFHPPDPQLPTQMWNGGLPTPAGPLRHLEHPSAETLPPTICESLGNGARLLFLQLVYETGPRTSSALKNVWSNE